jgi:hypothetical protein
LTLRHHYQLPLPLLPRCQDAAAAFAVAAAIFIDYAAAFSIRYAAIMPAA